MGKLTISRLALAITISGLLVYPATPSLAAPKWLQEMFTVDPPKSQKHRKPRRAKTKPPQQAAGAPGIAIRLPATAPVPESAPRDAIPVAQHAIPTPVAEDTLPQASETKNTPPDVEASSGGPAERAESLESAAAAPPEPEFRPDGSTPEADQAQAALPAEPPTPEFRPDRPAPEVASAEPGPELGGTGTAPRDQPPQPPDPRSARRPDPTGILPDPEAACRWRLTELGVTFRENGEQTDASGCSIPYPIVVEDLGPGIDLAPHAEMNCAMAEAAARFAKGQMSAAADDVFGAGIRSIAHASAYVCRPRNGSQKLSEHAFGNAIDIASFTLTDGTVVAVEPSPPEKHGEFLGKVRQAACGPFKTVLGPGSDADHAEHFHFDLAPRRNGGTVCE